MPRRFNPPETVSAFLRRSNHPLLAESLKKSLELFVEVLEEFREDERFSTAIGLVNLKDQFEGKQVTWQLNVKSSILQSLAGDNHISLTAIGEPEPDKTREMKVCVAKKGKLPIGDYLAQFLLLFSNGLHLTEIHTLKTAAMRVTYPKGTRIPSRIDPLEAYWQPYYQAVIAQDTPHEERVATALAHEHEHLRHIIIRLGGLDLDFEEQITYDELHLVLLDIFEQCVHADVKRLIVRRLHAREDAYVRFLSAREAGHHDERLLRALDYAIERMQNDLDRF